MQAVLILPSSPTFKFSYSPWDLDESANISAKLANNLRKKLKIHFRVNQKMEDENMGNEEAAVEGEKVDYGDKEEEEFSFNCMNSNVSLVSAEDVFVNGVIRPMFPIISGGYDNGSPLRPPLKKLLIQRPSIYHSSSVTTKIEERNGTSEDLYSNWLEKLAGDASSENCKKRGFSKLWKFREIFHRSKSDGKDAFVFKNSLDSRGSRKEKEEKVNIKKEMKKNSSETKNGVIKAKASQCAKVKTVSSANEKYYLINRAKKENDKWKSYLPYKLGFFSNINGMSRNIHHF